MSDEGLRLVEASCSLAGDRTRAGMPPMRAYIRWLHSSTFAVPVHLWVQDGLHNGAKSTVWLGSGGARWRWMDGSVECGGML